MSEMLRLFKRFLIFQVVFFLAYQALMDRDKASADFYVKYKEFLNIFTDCPQFQRIYTSLVQTFSKYIKAESAIPYIALISSLVVTSFLAVIGSRLSSFFAGVLFLFVSSIYLNPLLPENKIAAMYGIRKELILCVGVSIAMFLNSFYNPPKKIIPVQTTKAQTPPSSPKKQLKK
jgi:hypothetical protein